MRLGHVAIAVSDLDRMLGFYADMLGLRVSDVGTGAGRPGMPRIGFLSSDPPKLHHQLAFMELPSSRDGVRVLNHIAFEVDSLSDLRAVWSRVKDDPRAGGPVPQFGQDRPITAFESDQWSIRFADPEGNGVEVYAPTPWDAKAASAPYTRRPGFFFEPFDLDEDDDTLIRWGAAHLASTGQDHWLRGERPWTDG
jgi:catechol 2,3-dioxygenase-like lactoylglutathione lyase family enzyme